MDLLVLWGPVGGVAPTNSDREPGNVLLGICQGKLDFVSKILFKAGTGKPTKDCVVAVGWCLTRLLFGEDELNDEWEKVETEE